MTEPTRGAPGPACEPGGTKRSLPGKEQRPDPMRSLWGGEVNREPPTEELRVVHEHCGHLSLASTAPGGKLQEIADRYALETGAVVEDLVGRLLGAGMASDAELAAFAPVLHAALRDVLAVASRE